MNIHFRVIMTETVFLMIFVDTDEFTVTFLLFCTGASMILAELAMEAGIPDGVLNIVHGTNVCTEMLKFYISVFHASVC